MTQIERNPLLPFVCIFLFTAPTQSFAETAIPCPPPAEGPHSLYLPKELWDMIFQMAGKGADVSARTASKALQQRADHAIGQRGLDLSAQRMGPLSENQLKEIFAQSAILFPDLRELNLAYQVLSEDVLVAMKKAFPRLKILRLNNATINSAGLSELLNRPGDDLNPLEVLDLSNVKGGLAGPLKNYLGSRASANVKELILNGKLMDSHGNEILEALASREHRELTSLSLAANSSIDRDKILKPEIFAQVLRTHPQIKSLNLPGYWRNSQLGSQLLNLLKNTSLEELKLYFDSEANTASLTEFVRESKKLRKLQLSSDVSTDGAAAFAQAVVHSPTLKELKVVDFGGDWLPALSAALTQDGKTNETLRVFEFKGEGGWETSIKLLETCHKLEELSFDSNTTNPPDEVIASFITALSKANLKKLTLQMPYLSPESQNRLLNALANHKSLVSLKLMGADNRMVPALTQLHGTSNLRELDLRDHRISNPLQVFNQLVAPESHFPQLRFLDLHPTQVVNFDQIREIHRILSTNRTLEKVYLGDSNGLPDLSKIQSHIAPKEQFKSWLQVDPRISHYYRTRD